MDNEIVPGEIRIFPEYRGVIGTPPRVIGPTWVLREKRKGGKRWPRAPPLPSPIRTRGEGGARPTLAAPLSPLRPIRPITSPGGGSGNPPALRFSPKSPGTLPMSKHRLSIYQSLCLDHFETPRHVRDYIRDSEQHSVHQNA